MNVMGMDFKNLSLLLDSIAEEKGLSKERILEAVEQALAAAYKKEYGTRGQVVKAKLNPKNGEVEFWLVKLVVDESMIYSEEELEQLKEAPEQGKQGEAVEDKKVRFHEERHIMLKDAKKINPKIQAGEELETKLESKTDYGRIAAQTAKQVILQKIREAERESILLEFKSKEGDLVSGLVQRMEGVTCLWT